MRVTATLMPAKALDAVHRELIDRLMNTAAPAWFAIADDEEAALLAALESDTPRDYLASECATVDGAWRVFDLLSPLDRSTATQGQAAAVAAVLALAACALNMRELGAAHLGQVQDIDAQHPFVELILTEWDRNADAQSFRSAAAGLGKSVQAV